MNVTGTAYQLRPAFVKALQREGKRYERAEALQSKVQWKIGELALNEWRFVEQDAEGEITKHHFQAWASSVINEQLGYPLLTATGETLRRWMDVYEKYENLNGEIEPLKEVLPYDYFRLAASLAARPENEAKGITPLAILAKTYNEKWTDDEMRNAFGDGVKPHEYDRVIGWLDGLQGAKFEWIKDRTQRERFAALIGEARQIAENWK